MYPKPWPFCLRQPGATIDYAATPSVTLLGGLILGGHSSRRARRLVCRLDIHQVEQLIDELGRCRAQMRDERGEPR